MIRYDALEALPVRGALSALHDALDSPGTAVLVAPPGTGKTTLVPLALAGLLDDRPARRVVVAEPRRIAARAAARRMAWLLGEKPGDRVGHTVRGERVVGRNTRVEVVTTGVLLQRLQRDQELPGVDVVVLDECHERHLDADTAAAFLWDVREALRPELRLVAASATTDAEGWAALLGGGADRRGAGCVASGGCGVGAATASGAASARHARGPGAADACGVGGTAGAGRADRGRAVFSAGRGRDRARGGPAGGTRAGWRCSRCTGGRLPRCRTRCWRPVSGAGWCWRRRSRSRL
ncbi:hypothetical protein GCM10020256_58880 [Streptomyces thermocoprophilus]